MFGLGSFWPWIANKSQCVIKAINYLDKKVIRCQSLCLLWVKSLFWLRESKVADRAKPPLINIEQIGRAQTSYKKHDYNSPTVELSQIIDCFWQMPNSVPRVKAFFSLPNIILQRSHLDSIR